MLKIEAAPVSHKHLTLLWAHQWMARIHYQIQKPLEDMKEAESLSDEKSGISC